MNPLHLLWIIPITFITGFIIAAILAVGKESEPHAVFERK